jgi:hypothetical protein
LESPDPAPTVRRLSPPPNPTPLQKSFPSTALDPHGNTQHPMPDSHNINQSSRYEVVLPKSCLASPFLKSSASLPRQIMTRQQNRSFEVCFSVAFDDKVLRPETMTEVTFHPNIAPGSRHALATAYLSKKNQNLRSNQGHEPRRNIPCALTVGWEPPKPYLELIRGESKTGDSDFIFPRPKAL